ncbi:unnamed protein product [Amoebophrya sp. A120]|nr:unnamed protein product [Amoebophrya sp. A120]|eukprot:GSA120T00004854001.1
MVLVIDVTSDFACPWCYVGFKRLENAVSKSSEQVDIRWHPYMIDPATQKSGEPYLAYNRRRWGGDGWVAGMKRDALRDGCTFENWGGQNPDSVWAHTLHAHRLMLFVKDRIKVVNGREGQGDLQVGTTNLEHLLKKKLFEEYYEKGRNISLTSELTRIGQEFLAEQHGCLHERGIKLAEASSAASEGAAGLSLEDLQEKLAKFMASTDERDGYAEVLSQDKRAKTRGVSGVPFFEIRGVRHKPFSGAQPTEFWEDVLAQLAEK